MKPVLQRGASDAAASALGRELGAFVMVGGSGALAFVVLSSLLVEAHSGLPTWMVSTLCWAALIGPVYLAHRRFSFRSDAPHAQALPRYIGVQVCALLLASLFSYVCYSLFALPAVWASLIVTGLVSGVNFAVLRIWAFAHVRARHLWIGRQRAPRGHG